MDREAKVVSAGGVSRTSLMLIGGLVAAAGVAVAVAASCGGSGSSGASGGESGSAATYAFAGSWTFSSAKPTVSCNGAPLEARDLLGDTVTITSSAPNTVVYTDNGCSVPLTVQGSSAATAGPVSCPVGASGLAASYQSLELVAKDADTLSVTMRVTVKGGSVGYDCTSSVAAEIRRNPS